METIFNQQFLEALTRHDAWAEQHLVSFFEAIVQSRLRRRLRSAQAVEDATQETLFRVLTYFHSGNSLRTPAHLPAFVHSVLTNVAHEMHRAGALQVQLLGDDNFEAAGTANPEQAVMRAEKAKTVRRIMNQLPSKDQMVLRSLFFSEMDKEELCRNMHTNRNHLRVVLHRALKRFRAAVST